MARVYSNRLSEYAGENGGRVILLFLLFALAIYEFVNAGFGIFAIIEYPNMDDNSIPSSLLNMGTINLLVTRANRTWKDVDQKALKELQSQLTDQNTLFMYLTEAQRYAVEEFVGQLPPYTKFNNFVYRMSQMGLTAVENSHAK